MRIAVILAAAALAGCSKDYEDQEAALHDYLQGNKIGHSAEVYLVKQSTSGRWDRVGVFFGFYDDMEACEEFVAAYRKDFPENEYRCMFAN